MDPDVKKIVWAMVRWVAVAAGMYALLVWGACQRDRADRQHEKWQEAERARRACEHAQWDYCSNAPCK